MPVADYATYCQMLDHAKKNKFAYPAINVTSIATINAMASGYESIEVSSPRCTRFTRSTDLPIVSEQTTPADMRHSRTTGPYAACANNSELRPRFVTL